MDVDEAATKSGSKAATGDEGGEEDYSEVMNDPEFLQVSIMSPILIALVYRGINSPTFWPCLIDAKFLSFSERS